MDSTQKPTDELKYDNEVPEEVETPALEYVTVCYNVDNKRTSGLVRQLLLTIGIIIVAVGSTIEAGFWVTFPIHFIGCMIILITAQKLHDEGYKYNDKPID